MSPRFPGMDPFLEGSLWMSVHTQLCAVIAWQLAPLVRPKYLVLPTERFVLEDLDGISVTTSGSIIPDVGVARSDVPTVEPAQVNIATETVPLQLTTLMPARVPHVTIEIRDVAQRRLVTAIEVLSPTNKRGEGRDEYLAKRRHILLSTAHLVEIDLLRRGYRVPMREALPRAAYFVFVSRVERRPRTDVWPIELNQPLPQIPIPLQAPDADVALDLGGALASVYERLGLDLAVDYTQPPEVPFSAEEQELARSYLAALLIEISASTATAPRRISAEAVASVWGGDDTPIRHGNRIDAGSCDLADRFPTKRNSA